MCSRFFLIFFLCITFIFFGCGRPQKEILGSTLSNSSGMNQFSATVETPFAFLTSDYQNVTEVHFPKSSQIYLLEGGDYSAEVLGKELFVFARNARATIYRFSSDGRLLQEMKGVGGGDIQDVAHAHDESVVFWRLSDCKLYQLTTGRPLIDLSQSVTQQDYCNQMEYKTGAEANKIFSYFQWQDKTWLATYGEILGVDDQAPLPTLNQAKLTLNFGNPIGMVKTWPSPQGFLVVGQSGSYMGPFQSGLEIWDAQGDKYRSINAQELFDMPSARILDFAFGEGGRIYALLNVWNENGPQSTVVEITWLGGSVQSKILSRFSSFAMGINYLEKEKMVVVSGQENFRVISVGEPVIKEIIVDRDTNGRRLQNPSRIFYF